MAPPPSPAPARLLRSRLAGCAWPLAVVAAACLPGVEHGGGGEGKRSVASPRIVARCALPRTLLGNADAGLAAVPLGGVSDLFVEPVAESTPDGRRVGGGAWRLWAVTDRGPNGTVDVAGTTERTLVTPEFAPTIIEVRMEWDPSDGRPPRVVVGDTIPLAGRTGKPVSGCPNGRPNDPRVYDPAGSRQIGGDSDGVDTEGLVRLRDGSFWLAEEYRPSLLRVSAEGRVRARHVPRGDELPGADAEIVKSLPAVYATRRDNRGFEALAISADETRIFALMQSPLEHPARNDSAATGNVRLLAFDPADERPVAEYIYRLGPPAAPPAPEQNDDDTSRPRTKKDRRPGQRKDKDRRKDSDGAKRQSGSIPRDGKLCAMAAVSGTRLLVLEQAEGDVARLYLVDLAAATDTLARTEAATEPAIETLADPAAAGARPVTKTPVADLGPLVATMRSDIAGGPPDGARPEKSVTLKLEGLALLDDRHVALVNDDDFSVGDDSGAGPAPRTWLWIVELPQPVSAHDPLTSFP